MGMSRLHFGSRKHRVRTMDELVEFLMVVHHIGFILKLTDQSYLSVFPFWFYSFHWDGFGWSFLVKIWASWACSCVAYFICLQSVGSGSPQCHSHFLATATSLVTTLWTVFGTQRHFPDHSHSLQTECQLVCGISYSQFAFSGLMSSSLQLLSLHVLVFGRFDRNTAFLAWVFWAGGSQMGQIYQLNTSDQVSISR